MRTPDEIIDHHAGDRWKAATEIVRRYASRPDFTEAAERWCERCTGESSRGSDQCPSTAAAACFALLDAMCPASVPFREWLARARRKTINHREGGLRDDTSPEVMSALVALWPSRAHLERFPGILEEWSKGVSAYHRAAVAEAFADYPNLAELLLGPPRYEPPPADGICRRCGKQHASTPGDFETCYFHLRVGRRRRAMGLPWQELDDRTIQAIPLEHVCSDPFVVRELRALGAEGLSLPPSIWNGVERALRSGIWDPWTRAVAILASAGKDAARQEKAVTLIAQALHAGDPLDILHHLYHDSEGIFSGRGWGRKSRARRLLLLSRDFLGLGIWPDGWWRHALQGPSRVDGADEESRPEETTGELLAEALLAEGRDESLDHASRQRALEALGLLEPGGDGSWARALSTIKGPLEGAARAAQARMVERRTGALDPALAMEDACERRGVRLLDLEAIHEKCRRSASAAAATT